ncbi:50S ribosome-binding GTPase [Candidatus Pacearchaeota archaeon]|nr:50S ribosome-binding GTPase [Candidatus Pacearchaeota archaeon]
MVRVRYSFGSRHTGRIGNIKKQRGKYPDVVKDVVRISDIVLEVLDARFIEETRNLEVEKDILDKNKILVYVFNKSDLININEAKKSLPGWMKPYVFVSATKGIGLGNLKARIKMEAKRILAKGKNVKEKSVFDMNIKRVQVGVIGYPNSGKSSVINFITRRGVAKTAKQAGWTKGMQKIRMSETILILDTPGVIPDSKYSTEKNSFAKDVKVGARTYSNVKNPEDAVFYLMKEHTDIIEEFYDVKAESAPKGVPPAQMASAEADKVGNSEILIEKLGKKKGFLGKGGKVDIDRTARIILRDWQEGRMVANKD